MRKTRHLEPTTDKQTHQTDLAQQLTLDEEIDLLLEQLEDMAVTDKNPSLVAKPEFWNGDRKTYDAFNYQVLLYLQANKERLDTDEKKILTVLSFLRGGEAEEWAKHFFTNSPNWANYTGFWMSLEKTFKPFDQAGDAVNELETIRMGARPAKDHMTAFNMWLHKSEIKDNATIIRLFQRSIPTRILKQIMQLDSQPTTYKQWQDKTISF